MALRGSRPRGRRAAGGWAPCAALALGWALGWALGAEPPHRCRPDPALLPPPLRRLGGPALLRAAVPRLRGGWSPCQLYRYPAGSPRPNGTAPCTRGWHYALPAAGLRANLVTQWDLVCASRWKVPLEQTTHLLGWTLGSVTAGLACDRFGRRPTFLLCLALAVPVGLGVALAVDFLMVLVARLLFGAALAGAFLALYVARLELCDPPHRLGVTMVAGFFWMAGELLLPGLALLCRDWRVLQGAVTMILALLAASWWCPALLLEPPRWLLATRQLESARRSLQALAEDNCPQDSLAAELEALSEGPQRPRFHSVCEICGTRVIWKNGVILGFAAFIGSGIRHCFTRNLLPHLPHFFSSHLALLGTEAAACLFVCLTAERFGRRAILLLCTVLTGISSLLLLALTQYLLELIVLTLSVVGTAASHAVTMLSIFFASEVLPTVVRGAGLGLVLGANFVGKAAAPITAIPNSRGFFLHHVVFASFAILAVLSIMLLPESQGRALPQSLQDGESRRRPPLFRRGPREDHLPLLAPRALPPRLFLPGRPRQENAALPRSPPARCSGARGAEQRPPPGEQQEGWAGAGSPRRWGPGAGMEPPVGAPGAAGMEPPVGAPGAAVPGPGAGTEPPGALPAPNKSALFLLVWGGSRSPATNPRSLLWGAQGSPRPLPRCAGLTPAFLPPRFAELGSAGCAGVHPLHGACRCTRVCKAAPAGHPVRLHC